MDGISGLVRGCLLLQVESTRIHMLNNTFHFLTKNKSDFLPNIHIHKFIVCSTLEQVHACIKYYNFTCLIANYKACQLTPQST